MHIAKLNTEEIEVLMEGVFTSNQQRRFIEYVASNPQSLTLAVNRATAIGNCSAIARRVNKKLMPLKQRIMEHINVYFDQVYASKTDVIPYITQSWINYTDENQFHHKHSHPNSLVSGVLYLNADIDLDSIIFYRPKQYQTITIDTKDDCYNVFNSSLWTYSVKTRDIILFPSSLEHSVETKKGKNTRMSLAFNVFVKGNIGSTQGLSELKL